MTNDEAEKIKKAIKMFNRDGAESYWSDAMFILQGLLINHRREQSRRKERKVERHGKY